MSFPTFFSLSRRAALIAVAAVGAFACGHADAVVVRYSTNLGDIDVRLFGTATPLSVANFLNYVNDGDYSDSIIHRSVSGFVIQGGGYRWLPDGNLEPVPADAAVQNEFGISNLRGTLAYAKLGGDPNSATNGWFFSLNDNSGNLDNQNGGFTVFGRVLGDGMDVVDLIASQQVVNAGSPFDTLPVLDSFTPPNIFRSDLVFVNSVSVLDVPDGDYNFDGVVDAADYTVWRNSNGSTTEVEADGNGDGIVNTLDLQLWEVAYGAAAASLTAGGSAAPEPMAATLALVAGATSIACRTRR
ncbi:Peptidyl-prolyl cis-trans isomerase A precursor [Posidoniimonas polymericola]|uniref:Peptidyl-prolyl cis-trans isomerase n=1 Tax=Posidoniimonas polymericola TaxID=2528002 RepID=A0A5C5YHD5_9BACT|nr:peptidylprolyl isomerase [Posidoniimonas polymericola]TWT72732.1 Peptidyl-prolyl cis-trans isomerase A precursor [Posidoniimonas polymericola]